MIEDAPPSGVGGGRGADRTLRLPLPWRLRRSRLQARG